jgi:hypothetical protein
MCPLAGHPSNIISFVGIIGHCPAFEIDFVYIMHEDCLCCCLGVAGCWFADRIFIFFLF